MTAEEARLKAEENFHNGYNCTQAVVCVFAEQFGLNEKDVLRMVQPLGGGMCRMREVCGTVTGMLLTLGLAEGSDNPADKKAKDTIYEHGQKVAATFREQHGSIICKELLGLVPLGTSQSLLKSSSQNISQTAEQSVLKTQPTQPTPLTKQVGSQVQQKNFAEQTTSSSTIDSVNQSHISEMTSPVSEARTEAYYKKRPCQKLCGDAAAIIAEYLESKE